MAAGLPDGAENPDLQRRCSGAGRADWKARRKNINVTISKPHLQLQVAQ